ncbi:MAG: hypothetical protein RLZ94_291 [Actinomycetota bacterium]
MSHHTPPQQPLFDPELGAPAWRDFDGMPAQTWARVQECFVALRDMPRDAWHGAIDKHLAHDRQAGYEVLSLLIADEAARSVAQEPPAG